ncbi:hypothetical protein [Flavobacterium rivuli]|uniref:hypothetical protein n=1 Tax=Flavobacterium rivuli TaxID=498301 RepID=UPI0003782078|nr:hypothetical protein [Flavobacterium rivuli]
MARLKQVEKDYAKVLFVNDNLSQKEIAERINVTEKTIGKWVKDGKWDELKVSMLTTKDNQLKSLYAQLERKNIEIATRPIVRDIPAFMLKPVKLKDAEGAESLEFIKYDPEDYPIKIGNVPTSADADAISKITTAIKRLESETSIGDTIEVAKKLIQFIQPIDFAFAKQLTTYCDSYITSLMK